MALPEGQVNIGGWCAVVGVAGVSSSVFAADAVMVLATNPFAVWLMIVGIAFLVAEALLPNYGVIGLGGILMFVIGAVMLGNNEVPTPLIIGLALISALLLLALLIHALKTRPRHTVSGDTELFGSITPVIALQPGSVYHGWVHLQGERWQVRSTTPLQPGQRVQVVARKGLTLEVAATDAAPQGE
ncbi:NfeD family protein [Pseudomonas sp. RA_35y_Pfl2_P32]|uniref:NfeD family protein n=1 Tax=Pseudomonas sp. RA_35y_Pfl2_P32 TaxID=3088705 RepID=UPI0030D9E5F3